MITNFKIFEKYDSSFLIKEVRGYMTNFFDYIGVDVEIEGDKNLIRIFYKGTMFIDITSLNSQEGIYLDILDVDIIDNEFYNVGGWEDGKIISEFLIKIYNTLVEEGWILTSYIFHSEQVTDMMFAMDNIKDEIKIKLQANKYNL